jgi:alpha-1,6-mannosyltransferase
MKRSSLPVSLSICGLLSLGLSLLALNYLREWEIEKFVAAFMLQMGVYGYAAWKVIKGSWKGAEFERLALIAILLIAALMRGIALFAPQALSTDAFRYVWDGRVQAAGINPYRYVPTDPALIALRDDSIFPNINRADYAHTIYPPTAQISFLAIERISDSILGMKLAMLAFDALAIACLITLLRRRGLPETRVLLYAWHPLPVWEFAGTGHVDAVAIGLLMLAFLAASRRAPVWTGVALAAATLVKFYPAVAGPAMYRRWDWRMPVAFAAMLVLLYAPYLSVGQSVFGFLSGYADEEGLRSGDGIFLWSLLRACFHVPEHAVRYFAPLAAVLLLATAVWLQLSHRWRAHGTWTAALALASLFTLLVSPHDPWYFTWLIPFLCFRMTAAHVWLTGACTLMYVLPHPTGLGVQSLLYLPFIALLLLQLCFGRRLPSPEILHANNPHSQSRA